MTTPSPAASPITFITATRSSREDFFQKSPLYTSLSRIQIPDIGMIVAFDNTEGLPAVYNRMVDQLNVSEDTIFVFCHDDIHVLDFFWPLQIRAALERFDIIGLAGNRRRAPGQVSWNYIDDAFTWDDRENLSGIVGHGLQFPCRLTQYGPVPRDCLTLDGVFLGVRRKTLTEHGLRFDERFAFHLYDMDFCRQAEGKGLSMGTAPISVVHESGGNFGSAAWKAGYQAYLEKWGD